MTLEFLDSLINEREKFTVVSPRGFEDVYNFSIQLKAIDIALKRNNNLNFIMYGSKNFSYASKMVKDLSLEEKVHVFDKVSQDLLWGKTGKSRVVLSVPRRDGASLCLLESMALGAFPVVSDIPPNREWIKDKNNGFLVDGNSPEDIADAIISAVEDDNLFEKAFGLNFKIIEEKADYRKNIQKIKDVYQRLFK